MRILVLNCGSTTLKYRLFHTDGSGVAHALAGAVVPLTAAGSPPLAHMLDHLPHPPDAVAHRIVHGGDGHGEVALIDGTMLAGLESRAEFAPLHAAQALELVRAAAELKVPQVAAFDSAFHGTLPSHARRYALPEIAGLERVGFHGWSHRSVVDRYAAIAGSPAPTLVTLHLGGGCSAAAIRAGRSVDTSMGFTPLEGLMMGTRPGDLDPGIVLHLIRTGYTAERLEHLLQHESGLRGVAGDADMRALLARADGPAQLAVEMFCYRVRKYVGAYLAALDGVAEALIFTGGIGEGAPEIRRRVCVGLEWAGVILDPERNLRGDERISTDGSPLGVYTIPSNEEGLIAREASALLRREAQSGASPNPGCP
jgi:acetate kinase